MKWARPRLPRAERVCGLCGSGVGDELHMVTECPGYSVGRERHSGLFKCMRGLPGLMDRTIASEQLRLVMLQEQWQVADCLYECGQLRWQNPPAYLVPVQGDRQVQISNQLIRLGVPNQSLLQLERVQGSEVSHS
jgi:hypothetical protein